MNVKVLRDGKIKNINVKLETLPNAVNREDIDPFGEFNPFGRDRGESNNDLFDNELPFLDDLEKQCLETLMTLFAIFFSNKFFVSIYELKETD